MKCCWRASIDLTWNKKISERSSCVYQQTRSKSATASLRLVWHETSSKSNSQVCVSVCVTDTRTRWRRVCIHPESIRVDGAVRRPGLTLSIWSHYPWQYALRVYCRCVALLSRHCKSLNKQKMNCSVIAQPGHMELFVNSRLFTFQKVFFYLLSAAVLHNTISSANRRDVNCLAFSRRKVDFWKIACVGI